jgi:hypothetical protein
VPHTLQSSATVCSGKRFIRPDLFLLRIVGRSMFFRRESSSHEQVSRYFMLGNQDLGSFTSSPHFSCLACAVVNRFSCVRPFVTLWAIGQAPLSMGFSRQDYWSGLLCLPRGDLSDPRIKPVSPALASRFFTTSATSRADLNLGLQNFSGSPVFKTLPSITEVKIPSLVRELRPHMLQEN